MKTLRTVITILLLTISFQNLFAQWTTSHLSSAREYVTGISAGTKVVFAGGDDNFGHDITVDIYDYATGVWDTMTLLYGTTQQSGAWCNGKVYVPGDGNNIGLINVIDPAAKTISSDTMPYHRGYITTVSAAGKVFYAGGQDGYGIISNEVDIYNTYTQQWDTAYLSVARRNIAAAAAGSKVVFAGGELDQNGTRSDAVDIYDLSSGAWTTATLSEARTETVAAAAGTKILFGGGLNATGNTKRVDIYDVVAETWSVDSLSIARHSLAASSLGDKIYFGGGTDGNYYFDRVDVYNVDSSKWGMLALAVPRYVLSAASAGNQILFAGGIAAGWRTDTVEIFTDTAVVFTTTSSISNSSELKIFPNPASNEITVSGLTNSLGKINEVAVTDLSGKIIFSSKNISDEMKIDVTSWSDGIYFLKEESNQKTITQKFIVQH